MEKINKLMEICPDEINKFINELYKQKFPKKKNKKTIFKFKVLGKVYDNDVFTKNYIEFLIDISKIHPYEMFQHTSLKCYIAQTEENMKQSHKITNDFYVTSYSSTHVKINHIKNLCEHLGVRLDEI